MNSEISKDINAHVAAAPGTSAEPPSCPDTRLPLPTLRLASTECPDRAALEQRIADTFACQYGARIEHFLPLLLSLDLDGRPGSIAGFRFAARSALFLEQYLDVPVEQAIARRFREPIDRGQVVEIGNLVALLPGAGSILFAVLPRLLDAAGVRWVACTATPRVRTMLRKLGFPSQTICDADPAALGDGGESWGSYYESRPTVIAGDVRAAAKLARRNRDALRLEQILFEALMQAAGRLREARG